MPTPSDATVLVWSRLVRAQDAAMTAVEAALRSKGLPPLAWYDVLLELERGGPQRPKALQAQLLLAQYNLSRLLDRMVEAGLVARQVCESDRRGQVVAITTEGRSLRRRMWPTYARAIQAAVGARLSEEDAERLADLLGRLT